jgi:2-keto-4-pentenoate hydratase/2-oxohepta-3-ene-1,7-dioic acid hydratase in catechol pathway
MLFSFEEMIEHISQDETLMSGDFIGSGTVGNGCGLELGRFLKHGDMVELEVEKIGRLRNRVERQDLRSSLTQRHRNLINQREGRGICPRRP